MCSRSINHNAAFSTGLLVKRAHRSAHARFRGRIAANIAKLLETCGSNPGRRYKANNLVPLVTRQICLWFFVQIPDDCLTNGIFGFD